MTTAVSSTNALPAPRSRRMVRVLSVVVTVLFLSAIFLWIGIHRIPWLGPAIADGVRSVVGPAPVAWAQDVAYGVQDRVNRWRHGDDAPHTYWEIQTSDAVSGEAVGSATGSIESVEMEASSFPPKPFDPPHPDLASKADGVWVPMNGRTRANGSPTMVKSMVHPDRERPYTVLALVAMDLSRINVHAVPGTLEPRDAKFPTERRTGRVPSDRLADVIAAFNGGFQTIHGGYAMMVDGHCIGTPREDACTVALYREGGIRIRSWSAVSSETETMKAYRQTPRCLVEGGVRHPELENAYNTSWGAVVGGKTVIRRSALGLSEDGKTLFFGMGDALTARSLADGMKIAGAYDVAQLDVNHVFPRFVLFDKGKKGVEAVEPLCRGFSFSPGDYVKSRMARDFFYVTHRPKG